MLFSNEALEFLYINRLNDSREWYNEHKPEYRRLIIEPMTRLIDELTPTVLSIDPELDCTPKIGRCISRLYRDTRFSKDKSLYRDVVWCTFSQRGDALPCFFFEFSPRCVRWGMGYYCTPRPVMEQQGPHGRRRSPALHRRNELLALLLAFGAYRGKIQASSFSLAACRKAGFHGPQGCMLYLHPPGQRACPARYHKPYMRGFYRSCSSIQAVYVSKQLRIQAR